MTLDEKLEYIKKHCKKRAPEIKLYLANEVSEVSKGKIPEMWYKIFAEEDIDKRKDMVLGVWKKYMSESYKKTIEYLEDNLINVELLRVDDKYSMLYSIKKKNGKTILYEGGNLMEQQKTVTLESHWNKIPLSIRSFYENVHDGFYHYSSWSMGMDALKNVTYFNEYEWGILEELEEPLQINIATTFGFFNDCAGGYVAVDTENCNDDNATRWYSDDQPEYNQKFWKLVDEWTLIGLEG